MTAKPARKELVLRVNSAAFLIALALALTYAGPNTFTGLILFFAVIMGWEWGRVVRRQSGGIVFVVQSAAVAGAGLLTLCHHPASALGVTLAATVAAFWLHRWQNVESDPWWSAAGVYYAGFPSIALIAIRQDPQYGFLAVLYLFSVVWSTDTGAFLAGRLFGGPKLAPAISPNKTWTGLAGGVSAAFVTGSAFAVWFGETPVAVLGILAVVLALIAQLGDLGESAIKRFFGVKHSSGLIPGHGGVLDRLDGLVFAAVGAGVIAVAIDPLRPGRALLVW